MFNPQALQALAVKIGFDERFEIKSNDILLIIHLYIICTLQQIKKLKEEEDDLIQKVEF